MKKERQIIMKKSTALNTLLGTALLKTVLLNMALLLSVLCLAGCGASSRKQPQSGEMLSGKPSSEEMTPEKMTPEKASSENDVSSSGDETEQPDMETVPSPGKFKICIDPGHQGKGNNEQEPVGPGASETKKKVSYGTQGVSTKIAEYQLNLDVSLMLKAELIERGYDVFMIRESNDVNISNMERAIMGNESGADVAVRIHANGSDNQSVKGALTIYPSEKNPYVAYLSEDSRRLSESIINSLCSETGAKNRGALARDNYTGSNWSKIPVTIVEMGYMSNPEEDELMATEEYRKKIVKGIADGIDEYFKG